MADYYLDLETYFVLIFIGFLMIRELTDKLIVDDIKDRIDFLIFVFIIVFIVIFIKNVINYIRM